MKKNGFWRENVKVKKKLILFNSEDSFFKDLW
jgi:predicted sulfurtransferase